MNNTLRKIGYYSISLLIPIVILILFYCNKDFEKSINLTATLVQTFAIFIGGLWAYHKFGWEKKAESAIKIKTALIHYEKAFLQAKIQYSTDIFEGVEEPSAWLNYILKIVPARKEVDQQIHLSCYLPGKLRFDIFKLIEITESENVRDWEIFEKNINEIHNKLENFAQK